MTDFPPQQKQQHKDATETNAQSSPTRNHHSSLSSSTNETAYSHGKPSEGMCCLCTMEDITEDNYVEYQSYPSLKWQPSLFEQSIVQQLLETKFQQYIDTVQKSDCLAELRRLVAEGPPFFISDKHALPLYDENDTHICQLWYASDGLYRSAMLQGACTGKEREELWNRLKQLLGNMEEEKQSTTNDNKANEDS